MGSDASKLFPREVFDDHLKRFGKFGLGMAIMALPVFTSTVEDAPDMDAMAEKLKEANENENFANNEDNVFNFTSSKTIDAYNERMSGVFHDMYDLKYI